MLIKTRLYPPQQKPPLGSEIDWGHPLSGNLFACWLLNEGGGMWSDCARSGCNLGNSGGVALRPGSRGASAHFTAAQAQSLFLSDTTRLQMGDVPFTMAALSLLDSKTTARGIAGKYLGAGNQREYFLSYQLSSDRYSWFVSPDGSAVTTAAANNFGSPAVNRWDLVAAWHDPGRDQIGIQIGRGVPNTTAHATGVYRGTARFCLGVNDGGTTYHDGSIDMVGLWRCVLTSDQIAWLAAEPYAMLRPAGPQRRYFTTTALDQRFRLSERPQRFRLRELPQRFRLTEQRP